MIHSEASSTDPRAYAEISSGEGGQDICFWRSVNDEHSAQNCAGIGGVDLFWRSRVHSVKFGQRHAAITIMAADNHVPQFSDGGARIIFGK